MFPKWKQLRQTAVEIVYGRADSTKPNMGLITWKNAPQGRIRKSDVSIAKNYLNEEDILHDKGKVTAAIAKAFAESEFEKFRVLQDRTYQSDFDRLVANIEENRNKQNKSGNPTLPILLSEVWGFCIRFTDHTNSINLVICHFRNSSSCIICICLVTQIT